MKAGKELVLIAAKKELKRLSKEADKAKQECDEYMRIGTEAITIHEEFVRIVNTKETGQSVIDQLELLRRRRHRVQRIMKKDLIKLTDREIDTALTRDGLNSEIQMMEYKWGR